jgi:hypothetical protein
VQRGTLLSGQFIEELEERSNTGTRRDLVSASTWMYGRTITILSYSPGRSESVGIGPRSPTSPPGVNRCIILSLALFQMSWTYELTFPLHPPEPV